MKIFDRKYSNLLRELTLFNFKLRDQGTVLGFIWTLLHPFLMLTILYMLFSKRLGKGIEHYEIYLLIGIIQWNFLSTGTNEGLKSIMNNRSILRNIYIFRTAVVVSSVLAVAISFLLELLVLGGFYYFLRPRVFSGDVISSLCNINSTSFNNKHIFSPFLS